MFRPLPWFLLPLLALLGACSDEFSSFGTVQGDDDSLATDDDSTKDEPVLGPHDDWHLLISSDGWNGPPPFALTELDSSGSAVWTVDFEGNSVAEGLLRKDNGHTLITRVDFTSHDAWVEELDALGGVVWSTDGEALGGLHYTHDMVETAAGDLILADTEIQRIIAASLPDTLLWTLDSLKPDGKSLLSPNGLSLRSNEDGSEDLLLSGRGNFLADNPGDGVMAFRLGEREEEPSFLWQFPEAPDLSLLATPHGPRWISGGGAFVCSSTQGHIVGLDDEGQEVFRLPPKARWGVLDEPRDALFLPDGRLLVANSGSGEILWVEDPWGAFTISSRAAVPGPFRLQLLTCDAKNDGLPCLGVGATSP